MTRTSWTLLCSLALLGGADTIPASAQFGFFGSPYQQRRVYRPRRSYVAPHQQAARPQQAAPQQQADVPLPPPRPAFPGDQPTPAETRGTGSATETKSESAADRDKRDAAKPDAVAAPGKAASPAVPPPAAAPKAPAAPEPAKPALGPNLPPKPPEKPAELTKPAAPGVAPSGAKLGEAPRQPEDDAACPSRLSAHNIVVEPTTIGPQSDPRCTVVQAVRLKELALPGGGKVEFPEHPTIACTTAETFSTFVRDLLSPLAKGSLGAPVSAVWTGPGLECRSMDHIVGAKLSAHGQGLAIDIAQVKLADGRMIEVGTSKDEASQTFERAAQNAACGYFHTVLGPGTDAFHKTHWHFDLIVRGAQGDTKYCR